MLILPREFPELKALIQRISEASSSPAPDPPLPPIGEQTVCPNSFDVVDGILSYNLESHNAQRLDRVVLYQPWVDRFRDRFGRDPRYHILHCSTIQKMQQIGNYSRYVPTIRTDGKFPVVLNDEDAEIELLVCRNCLKFLKERCGEGVFPQNPEEFSLADWLETFEFDYSSADWKERSRACRENANWRCEQCGIDLEFHRHLLHAHHKWGTLYDKPEDLIALCIGCHAQQNGDGHRTLEYHPAHQQFMQRYGAIWRARRQKIQNRTSTADYLDDIPW